MDTFHPDALPVLRRFVAAQAARPDVPFHFRPIEGYAFAWILHPGFDDGVRMSGLTILHQLEQAGFIRFADDGFPHSVTTFTLTGAGMSSELPVREGGIQHAATNEPHSDA